MRSFAIHSVDWVGCDGSGKAVCFDESWSRKSNREFSHLMGVRCVTAVVLTTRGNGKWNLCISLTVHGA